ncbi:unnamed protein product [Colias eurytheme]|nr:unnamed protein product [Colias eurytheme]
MTQSRHVLQQRDALINTISVAYDNRLYEPSLSPNNQEAPDRPATDPERIKCPKAVESSVRLAVGML